MEQKLLRKSQESDLQVLCESDEEEATLRAGDLGAEVDQPAHEQDDDWVHYAAQLDAGAWS